MQNSSIVAKQIENELNGLNDPHYTPNKTAAQMLKIAKEREAQKTASHKWVVVAGVSRLVKR